MARQRFPVKTTHADGSTSIKQPPQPYRKRSKKRKRRIKPQNYNRYIRSKHWARRRKAYFATHPRRCALCGVDENLHIHHCNYQRLGHERDEDLAILCESCHMHVHKLQRETGLSVARVTLQVFKPWEGL